MRHSDTHGSRCVLFNSVDHLLFETGPSMSCMSGPCGAAPSAIRCRNTGTDLATGDPTWECLPSPMPPGINLHSFNVAVKGCTTADDPYVVRGSWRLEYSLTGAIPGTVDDGSNAVMGVLLIVMFTILCAVVVDVCNRCCRDRPTVPVAEPVRDYTVREVPHETTFRRTPMAAYHTYTVNPGVVRMPAAAKVVVQQATYGGTRRLPVEVPVAVQQPTFGASDRLPVEEVPVVVQQATYGGTSRLPVEEAPVVVQQVTYGGTRRLPVEEVEETQQPTYGRSRRL